MTSTTYANAWVDAGAFLRNAERLELAHGLLLARPLWQLVYRRQNSRLPFQRPLARLCLDLRDMAARALHYGPGDARFRFLLGRHRLDLWCRMNPQTGVLYIAPESPADAQNVRPL